MHLKFLLIQIALIKWTYACVHVLKTSIDISTFAGINSDNLVNFVLYICTCTSTVCTYCLRSEKCICRYCTAQNFRGLYISRIFHKLDFAKRKFVNSYRYAQEATPVIKIKPGSALNVCPPRGVTDGID